MREVLFRGKRTDNGEWAEGFLVDARHVGNWVIAEPVNPETVGQFTGLTDKNGKKIFEGDIIKYMDSDEKPIAVIKFGTGRILGVGFYVEWESSQPCLRQDIAFWATKREIEIIGNIHDTPELLEE